jgi:hypothetical protein
VQTQNDRPAGSQIRALAEDRTTLPVGQLKLLKIHMVLLCFSEGKSRTAFLPLQAQAFRDMMK